MPSYLFDLSVNTRLNDTETFYHVFDMIDDKYIEVLKYYIVNHATQLNGDTAQHNCTHEFVRACICTKYGVLRVARFPGAGESHLGMSGTRRGIYMYNNMCVLLLGYRRLLVFKGPPYPILIPSQSPVPCLSLTQVPAMYPFMGPVQIFGEIAAKLHDGRFADGRSAFPFARQNGGGVTLLNFYMTLAHYACLPFYSV
eukprot:1093510-Pleurochrysis_carterae.AAC.2